jgi:excinuclease UvrABC helicase subunit UvrB
MRAAAYVFLMRSFERSFTMTEKKKETTEKPLDKMTVKELREIAKEIPSITGASGMNKEPLLAAIKEQRGIKDEVKKTKSVSKEKSEEMSVKDLKNKIRTLKGKKEQALEANDNNMAVFYRRKISKLKKRTRRAA